MKKVFHIDEIFKTAWEQLTIAEMIRVIDLSGQLINHEIGSKEYGYIVIAMLRTLRKDKSAVAKLEVDQAVDCFNDLTFFQRTAQGEFQSPWLFFPIKKFSSIFQRPEMSGELPMYNRSFDQLVFADSAYSNFCVLNHRWSTQKATMNVLDERICRADMDECISALITVLYTEPEQFKPEKAQVCAEIVRSRLTIQQQGLILHTYANVRSFIIARCPYLFPKSKENMQDDQQDNQQTEPQSTGEIWMNLRYDLAETEAFKGFSTACNAMIYDALDYLNKKAKDAQEQKAKAQTT